jgi:acyl-CoA synthetase (AMP-forming)/AMP-acid ligase II
MPSNTDHHPGLNHYPQDIEQTVQGSHPALRPAATAAFSVEIDRQERLVVVQEVDRQHRNPDVEEIVNAVRRGIDSLMAVELKNHVESQVSLPLIQVIQGPSVAELATLVLENMPEGAPASCRARCCS